MRASLRVLAVALLLALCAVAALQAVEASAVDASVEQMETQPMEIIYDEPSLMETEAETETEAVIESATEGMTEGEMSMASNQRKFKLKKMFKKLGAGIKKVANKAKASIKKAVSKFLCWWIGGKKHCGAKAPQGAVLAPVNGGTPPAAPAAPAAPKPAAPVSAPRPRTPKPRQAPKPRASKPRASKPAPAVVKPVFVSTPAPIVPPGLLKTPTGTSLEDLQQFSAKKVIRVMPEGVNPQQKGDKKQNEKFIADVKFDLRWAKSIKEKHIKEGVKRGGKAEEVNSDFLDFQAKNTRLPLIKPALFND